MSCDVNIVEKIFNSNKFNIMELDKINFSTGSVVLSDPYYMVESKECIIVMEEKIEPKQYPVLIASNTVDDFGSRIFASKIVIENEKAEKYEILKPEGRKWQVVGIDTGLCAVTDKSTQDEFNEFYKNWKNENKDKNFYSDYLKNLFSENNDIGIWKSKKSDNKILMFLSRIWRWNL